MTGKEYFTLYERSRDKAYDALFEEYCNYVYAIVYNRLRGTASREDMEECVSDIFADVFFGFAEGISADGDMKGYIGTVAKRRSINAYHRLAAQQRHLSDSDEEKLGILKSDKDIEADSEVKDTTSILLSRINELGEPDSTIILSFSFLVSTGTSDRRSTALSSALLSISKPRFSFILLNSL